MPKRSPLSQLLAAERRRLATPYHQKRIAARKALVAKRVLARYVRQAWIDEYKEAIRQRRDTPEPIKINGKWLKNWR